MVDERDVVSVFVVLRGLVVAGCGAQRAGRGKGGEGEA